MLLQQFLLPQQREAYLMVIVSESSPAVLPLPPGEVVEAATAQAPVLQPFPAQIAEVAPMKKKDPAVAS
jgi:hypothetical protein